MNYNSLGSGGIEMGIVIEASELPVFQSLLIKDSGMVTY